MMPNLHALDGVAVVALVGVIAIIVESCYSLASQSRQKAQRGYTPLYDKGVFLHNLRICTVIGIVFVILVRASGSVSELAPIAAIIAEVIWLYVLLRTRSLPDRIYGTLDGLLILRRGVADTIPYADIDVDVEPDTRGYEYIITFHFRKPGKFGSAIQFNDIPSETDAFLDNLDDCMERADTLRERPPPRNSGAIRRPSQRVSPGAAQEVTSTAYLLIGTIGLAVSVILLFVFT
jgi:hypothetical protein